MKKLLSIAASIAVASIFFACSNNGINASDATNLISGPNSFKGTISGTMRDTAVAYSFPFDYHYTANDGNSSSESWIENNAPYDSVLEVWQYIYFDRNGYDDYGDNWSASGKYIYLDMYINMATMTLKPSTYSTSRFEGMWQNITSKGNRFVYGMRFYNNSTVGTLNVTNLKYDKASQILSGKVSLVLPADPNHVNQNWYQNYNATTITGDLRVYVPKENFQLTKKSSYYGQVYRTHK